MRDALLHSLKFDKELRHVVMKCTSADLTTKEFNLLIDIEFEWAIANVHRVTVSQLSFTTLRAHRIR